MPHGDDHWMVTATGGRFWPLDPHIEDIKIEDISHHLSMICRFGGTCLRFYSVAQHSVIISSWAEKMAKDSTISPVIAALWGLLHDAPEAYLGDMIRPLKHDDEFSGIYRRVEKQLMDKICEKFGLPYEMPDIVKKLDTEIVVAEREQLLHPYSRNFSWTAKQGTGAPLPVDIVPWEPAVARYYFLARFNQLCSQRLSKSATS